MSQFEKIYLKRIGNVSVVDNIVDQLVTSIINGNIHPGDKIPTEIELAEMFSVGRSSVREAIKVLVSYGILEIRRAEGTYVCTSFSEAMLNPLLYGIILEQDSSQHLAELRQAMEVATLQLAILHATEEDISILKGILNEFAFALRKECPDPEEISNLDFSFHTALEAATHNPLFAKVCNIIDNLARSSQLQTNQRVVQLGEGEHLIETHTALLNTVLTHDVDSIPQALRNSYKYWTLLANNHSDQEMPDK